MTIPAVSRRSIAIKLAATVWMSSARTTRRTHDADVRGVEARAGQGRRDHDIDPFGVAQPDLPRSALEQELGLGRLAGAEIDEDIQAFETAGHRGGDAIERGQRTRRDAQRMPGGRRDAPDLSLEDRIGKRDRTHGP